jgi:hypothetical protein
MEDNFILIIKSNQRKSTLIILIICLIAFLIGFRVDYLKGESNYLMMLACIVIFLIIVSIFWGTVRVVVDTSNMVVEDRIFGISYSKSIYLLDNISDLQSRLNDKANSYTSYFSADFEVFEYTPESSKIYNTNPVVLFFKYKGEMEKIGEGLESFNAELLKKEILKRIEK